MKRIEIGDTVTVNYTGRLEDGSVFDTSLNEGREPLIAKLGEGQLIKGFENGLLDMSVGERKTIEIEPENAYGVYNNILVGEVPKGNLPEDVKIGDTLQGMTEQGPIVVRVVEILEDTVRVDANHPLAGRKLIFDLDIIDIK